MLIEAARRAEAAVKEMLAVANEGTATTDDLVASLGISKSIAGINSAFQVASAAAVAGRRRHGDGGAEVLASSAGLTRGEARSQVKTAETLRTLAGARDAIESGRVSVSNAKRLAEAVEKTSGADVESDRELLAKAQSMRPEQFTKEARRWVADREQDGGASEHARQRARRSVRVWNADDGMVHLHGEFDAVAGQRIGNRLQEIAGRLYDADKKNANGSGEDRRTFHQCMADALDALTDASAAAGTGKPFADICVVAHVDNETGKLIAELPDGDRLPSAVLEELACGAKLTGVVYDRDGKPIWRAHSVRTATEAQRQILIARYGGCFACAAHPALCQIHHIKPVSEGGSTKISNMVPVCWDCHTRIHHHRWFINKRPDGNHTLHPPGQPRYGPAHAPEQPAALNLVRERPANPTRRPSNTQPQAPQPSAVTGQTDQGDPAGEAHPRAGPLPPAGCRNGSDRLFALA